MEPGPRNAITDVAGIRVGQAEAADYTTGTTALIAERPAVAAVDLRGGAPGLRASEGLIPGGVVERIDAVVLSGGSAYGLDAAGGAMDWLRHEGRGFPIGGTRVPIVAAAILFDLLTGSRKDWDHPPYWHLGREAAARAGAEVALGNAGAGLGAAAGPIKGGTGTASIRHAGVTVGALAVVNPLGSVLIPGTRTFWAWWLEQAGEVGGQTPPAGPPATLEHAFPGEAGGSTTLAVVATDATLTREQALRVAVMAQDGLARAIRPVHAPLDGDVVFALSTERGPAPAGPAALSRIGMLAADTVARAIMRGVHAATGLAGIPAWRDLDASGAPRG